MHRCEMKFRRGVKSMKKYEKLQNPGIQYRPDVRWWLAEGFHTDETLKEEIADLE